MVFLSILFSVLDLNTFSSYKYINDNYAITKKKHDRVFFYVAELNLKLKQSILDVFVCCCSTLRMCSYVTYQDRNYHGYNILSIKPTMLRSQLSPCSCVLNRRDLCMSCSCECAPEYNTSSIAYIHASPMSD